MAREAPPAAADPAGPAADPADEDDRALLRRIRIHPLRRFLGPPRSSVLTRFVLLRLLGFVYFIAFFSLARQLGPLLGPQGLLPADRFLERLVDITGSPGAAFRRLPTLFLWLGASDGVLHAADLVYKLLSGDAGAQRLLARNPFPDAPPRDVGLAQAYLSSPVRAAQLWADPVIKVPRSGHSDRRCSCVLH
jgi:hypothetical protein